MGSVEPFVSGRMYILGKSLGIQVYRKIERTIMRSTGAVVTEDKERRGDRDRVQNLNRLLSLYNSYTHLF